MSKKKHKRRDIEQGSAQKSQSKNGKAAKYMDYEVGYGRPPIHSRFKKGQSGNPAGRPKEPTTLKDALNKVLSLPINVIENGQKSQITRLMGIVKNYTNELLKPNNYKYMQLFIKENAKDVNIESQLYPTPIEEPESEEKRRERMWVLGYLNEMTRRKIKAGESFESGFDEIFPKEDTQTDDTPPETS